MALGVLTTALSTRSHEVDSLIHVISDMQPVYCKCQLTVIHLITFTIMRNFKHAQQDVFSSITFFFLNHFCSSKRNLQPLLRLPIAVVKYVRRSNFSINLLFSTAFSIQCKCPTFRKKTSSLKNKQKNSIYFFARRQFLHKVDYILQLSRQAIQYLHHRSILNFFARNSFIYVGFIYFVSRIFSELIIYISWFIII